MFPPRLTAPEKVTKSPVIAPWLADVTVMVEEKGEAVTAAKVTDCVFLIGVISE